MSLTFGVNIKPRMTAVSYSRLSAYEKCPAQAKYKFVDRLPEPDSPHLERGKNIHTMCEDFLKDPEPILHEEIAAVSDFLSWIRDNSDHTLETEMQVAFNKDWGLTDWFSPDVLLRVVYDALCISSDDPNRIMIVDHKTGKVYDAHQDQMSLYALAALHQFPDAEVVDVRMLYVDQAAMTDELLFTRDDLDRLHENWDPRIARATADEIFSPNPSSFNCNWCTFAKSKGGPCNHG